MLLKHLHDEDSVVRNMSNLILKTRGLSQELIGMGGLMFSPQGRPAGLGHHALERPDRHRPGDLADPAFERPGRNGADQRPGRTCAAQDAAGAKAAGRDGSHRHVRSGAPGCPQARPGRRRDDGVASPPARLVELESEGELREAGGSMRETIRAAGCRSLLAHCRRRIVITARNDDKIAE